MSHVSDRSTAEFIPTTEDIVSVIFMIRHIRNRTEPKIPIESCRNGLDVGGSLGPLLPSRAIRPIVNSLEFADQSLVHPGFHLAVFRSVSPCEEMRNHAGFFGFFNDFSAFKKSVGNGFVSDHVDSFVHRGQSNGGMCMIRSHDFDGIDTFSFCKKFSEILVGSAAFIPARWFVFGVVFFDVFLPDVASAGDSRFAFPPGIVLEHFPDIVSDSIGRPVDVVR